MGAELFFVGAGNGFWPQLNTKPILLPSITREFAGVDGRMEGFLLLNQPRGAKGREGGLIQVMILHPKNRTKTIKSQQSGCHIKVYQEKEVEKGFEVPVLPMVPGDHISGEPSTSTITSYYYFFLSFTCFILTLF